MTSNIPNSVIFVLRGLFHISPKPQYVVYVKLIRPQYIVVGKDFRLFLKKVLDKPIPLSAYSGHEGFTEDQA
jgi:hypothetical protein